MSGPHPDSDEHREHMRRLSLIVDRWRRGETTVSQKRLGIAAENSSYYGGTSTRSPTTGEPLCQAPRHGDPSIGVLADSAGVPFEAMAAALAVRRRANWQAAHADTMSESREIIQSGFEGYRAILASARPGRVPDRAVPPPPPDSQTEMDW